MSNGYKTVWLLTTSTGGNVDKEFENWEAACEAGRHWAAKNPNITYYIWELTKVVKCKPVEIEEFWPAKPPHKE